MNEVSASVRPLYAGFLDAADRFPDRPALEIGTESLTFRGLARLARQIAATIQMHAIGQGHRLTGVFGHRSFTAFAGVLGALLKGDGYVPLNPEFPPERSRSMAQRAELDWIVVEKSSLSEFEAMLQGIDRTLSIIVPDSDSIDGLNLRFPNHRFYLRADLLDEDSWAPADLDEDALAYLLFTSGSTGQPKGVMVAQRNVLHFVDVMVERYDVSEHDRFSQTFDLTFDLSAFDMFVAWERGACVCCPTKAEKLFPGKYIRDHRVTVWFGVPSTAVMMKKLRMLQPDRFGDLRLSLFCGEALPLEVADSFARAAPNSTLENLYGPTELTIACTLYRYDAERTAGESEQGIVPIGDCYPGMRELIVDESLRPVELGEAGELLMTGPQLTLGYWRDDERTNAAFVKPPGQNAIYYRTGDRVRRRAPDAPLVYLGRIDNQIKVQGYRVELGEIEAVIRDVAGTEVAVAVGHPSGPNGVEGILGFISAVEVDTEAVRDGVRKRLPPYMQPRSIIHVDEFPLNANGKVDRGALLRTLQR